MFQSEVRPRYVAGLDVVQCSSAAVLDVSVRCRLPLQSLSYQAWPARCEVEPADTGRGRATGWGAGAGVRREGRGEALGARVGAESGGRGEALGARVGAGGRVAADVERVGFGVDVGQLGRAAFGKPARLTAQEGARNSMRNILIANRQYGRLQR
jgi:hypothetical protein